MILNKYKNGDFDFTIYSDGTLIRETNVENPKVVHPSSIDVKITDYCDMGCLFCHESSTKKGKHSDLDKLIDVISELPAGIEMACGGGDPLSHPNLIPFLETLKSKGIISNITVNQGHLKRYQELLTYLIKNDLVKGIGISITNNNFNYVKPLLSITNNIVYHLIGGINKVEDVQKLIELDPNCKVLILGYKLFGFGVNYYTKDVDIELGRWYKKLPNLIGKCVISFDNLAIEQLKVKRLFTDVGWSKFYMGDDFTFTMYIDAVKQEFAPTSRSKERKSFDEYSLIEYFQSKPIYVKRY
jgi:hypothetical protein